MVLFLCLSDFSVFSHLSYFRLLLLRPIRNYLHLVPLLAIYMRTYLPLLTAKYMCIYLSLLYEKDLVTADACI